MTAENTTTRVQRNLTGESLTFIVVGGKEVGPAAAIRDSIIEIRRTSMVEEGANCVGKKAF